MLYSFDNFTLDTQRYQLRRTGQPIPLEPQVFKVLTYLVQHYDRVVPRQELFERLWPGQYVSDDALGRCIRKARQAFGDRREAPRFIKTLPRHGYHFIAPVTVQTHDAHACALLTAIDDVSNEAELLQTLERLQRAEFLYETPVGSERTYMFKHALTQEVAYGSVLHERRQTLHARVAQVLTIQFPETVDTQPELLAQHYTAAGLHAQAIHYWHTAGQRAIERSANAEAIAHLQSGLDLLQMSPETPERIQQELAMHLALGAALIAVQGYAASAVEQTYTRARQLCQHLEDPRQLFPVLRGLWNFYFVGPSTRRRMS